MCGNPSCRFPDSWHAFASLDKVLLSLKPEVRCRQSRGPIPAAKSSTTSPWRPPLLGPSHTIMFLQAMLGLHPQEFHVFAQTSTRHSTVAGGGLNGITNLMHSRHVQLFPNIIERGSCFRWSTAECKCFTSPAFVETSRFPELHMHETSSPKTLPKLTPRQASGWKVHPSPHTVKLHVTSVFIFPRHRHSSPFRARPPGPTLSPRKGQQSGSYAPTTP